MTLDDAIDTIRGYVSDIKSEWCVGPHEHAEMDAEYAAVIAAILAVKQERDALRKLYAKKKAD